MLVPRQPKRISALGVATQQDSLTSPTTGAVVSAFVDEAFEGVGTLQADIMAGRVEEAEVAGTPITMEEYRESEFFRKGVPYYGGMTDKSAELLAKRSDEMAEGREIISKASTGQTALGFGAAFGAGMFEPKNLGAGLAVSLASGGLGIAASGANSARRLLSINRQTGRYKTLAKRGFAEGAVAAAIMEPSNRKSAKILQEEYEISDTLWNIGLSAALGAGINVAPAYIRDKWNAHGKRTADIVAAEMDVALGQLASGKGVDVRHIELMAVKDVLAKTINEADPSISSKTIVDNIEAIKRAGGDQRVEVLAQELGEISQAIQVEQSNIKRQKNSIDAETQRFTRAQRERLEDKTITQAERKAILEEITIQERRALENRTPEQQASIKRSAEKIGNLRAQQAETLDRVKSMLGELNQTLDLEINNAIKRASDPSVSTAFDVDEMALLDDYHDGLLDTPDYEASFQADVDRLRAMVEDGQLNEEALDEFFQAVDNNNGEDALEALNILEGCMTRG